MKKLSAKQKRYQLKRSRKQILRQSRIKKRKSFKSQGKQPVQSQYTNHIKNECRLIAPSVLSISENEEGTLGFFEEVFKCAKECKKNQYLYFDFKGVKVITPEVIMYVIALVYNIRSLNYMGIDRRGCLPDDAKARVLFEDVGFFDYVNGPKKTHSPDKNKRIQILHGNQSNSPVAGQICDFVSINYEQGGGKVITKQLYRMIVELMTNTRQHAYNERNSELMDCNWYIYAENLGKAVRFIFLDTGSGIPRTIRYNFFERVQKLLIQDDAGYIASALKGAFRTETNMQNRGKGLPGIYKDSIDGRIQHMVIISGRGRCEITNTGEIIEKTLSKPFIGTLFCWEFSLKGDR